jgi:hypothetical protein
MRDLRFTLIRIIAIVLVIGLAVISPLFSLPAKNGLAYDINVPPQPVYVTTFDRPRPEIRIERVLKLDDFTGFDPDLASLFEAARRPQTTEVARADRGGQRFEQVASISHQGRGGTAR